MRSCGRIPGQIHNKPAERERQLKLGRAIEELITTVSPATFFLWVLDKKSGKPATKNPKGGQRKPKEIGYNRILGELRKLGIK